MTNVNWVNLKKTHMRHLCTFCKLVLPHRCHLPTSCLSASHPPFFALLDHGDLARCRMKPFINKGHRSETQGDGGRKTLLCWIPSRSPLLLLLFSEGVSVASSDPTAIESTTCKQLLAIPIPVLPYPLCAIWFFY